MSNEKDFNQDASWLKDQESIYEDVPIQQWEDISIDEVKCVLSKSSKWKSPGIDKIPNYWINSLHSTHSTLTKCYNDMMRDPNLIPDWFVKGTTYLLPKSSETKKPKNYRPITCLTTSYKILTSVLTDIIF